MCCQGRLSCRSRPPPAACLPAGRPSCPPALPPRPAALGAPRPSPRGPGLAHSSLLPTRARAAAAAAAGAAETITGGGSCGGAGNGPGGAGRRVPPRPFSGSALGRLWRSGQTQSRADGGVRNEGSSDGSGRRAGSWGAAGKERSRGEAWERGAPRMRARTTGVARGRRMGALEAGRIADEVEFGKEWRMM